MDRLGAGFSTPIALEPRRCSSTVEIPIPSDPLERVIGQEKAVEIARIAAYQHRHLLLVGPPGVGKSMTAQALALHLERPRSEIRIWTQPGNPERPSVEVVGRAEVHNEAEAQRSTEGELIQPSWRRLPPSAERLGYRCPRCSFYSAATDRYCPSCGNLKPLVPGMSGSGNPFRDLVGGILELTVTPGGNPQESVRTTRSQGWCRRGRRVRARRRKDQSPRPASARTPVHLQIREPPEGLGQAGPHHLRDGDGRERDGALGRCSARTRTEDTPSSGHCRTVELILGAIHEAHEGGTLHR